MGEIKLPFQCGISLLVNLSMPYSMQVQKRDGAREDVSFDKVLQRIRKSSRGLTVNPDILAQQVLARIVDNIKTSELDELTAQMAASLCTTHPDWGTLASRIAISNHHKNTEESFSKVMLHLDALHMSAGSNGRAYIHWNIVGILKSPLAEKIDTYIKYDRDYEIDYFGFKTLERSYLLKVDSVRVVERPQHMWMRVALCLWGSTDEACLEKVFETYDLLSQKYMTHATPTLFSAGTPRPQLSSCYLIAMSDDSISGIYKTLGDCAMISKYAGGIGLHIHNIRARGALIRGTNGIGDGIVPMLRVFNNTARYVNQGGRRNGSFAVYLEPWHADIEDFLKLKLNSGSEEERARDLFYALWVPDIFMRRVEEDGIWSLFCPSEAAGLADVYGKEFDDLYQGYESLGRARKTVSARKLWFQILDTQMETGTPYLLYKDPANQKSNQKNLGTIKSSNLCTEIIQFSNDKETAVCNLASLALPMYVTTTEPPRFDYALLRKNVHVVVRNLNRVIDINYYPTPETERSNKLHRPVGLGVQGLADVFAMLRLSWESPEATELNQRIFEHIYYAAIEASSQVAAVEGAYSTFEGSPVSEGRLQPDLWGVTPLTEADKSLDWPALRLAASKGVRNSLLVAPMPTASTSQILGFNECFEPFTTNIYTRRTLAGEFIVINKYLMRELIAAGIWTNTLKQEIVARNGSVQGITAIPADVQERYKTSWEIPQKVLVDMAAGRGAFICQSQSLNLFVAEPNYAKLTSMHFYAWKKGLKTGCYYLRTKAPISAQKFTVDPRLMAAIENQGGAAGPVNEIEENEDSDTGDEEEEEAALPPETHEQKMSKSLSEYREKLAKAKAAALAGEECTMCSA